MDTSVLEWSTIRGSSNMNDKDALEGLQPHPNIRSLKIKKYIGEAFPPWLLIPAVHNLVVLKLEGFHECKQLPRLGHLSHLKIVEIKGMYGVEVIGAGFYSSSNEDRRMPAIFFPALKILSLKDMGSLVERMVLAAAADGVQVVFPCLEELYIDWCSNLKSIPATLFPALKRLFLREMRSLVEWLVPAASADGVQVVFSCLEELYIHNCLVLKSIPSMTHLSSKFVKLDISDCHQLSHLSGEFHAPTSSLKYLRIHECKNLASIPSLQHCTTLEELYIKRCYKLVSIAFGGDLQSLKRVRIYDCRTITSLPIRRLLSCPSLEELIIHHCWEFIFLFEDDDDDDVSGGGELLPSSRLKSFEISYCDKLTSVPDGLCRRGLHSLVRLQIH